MGLSNFEELINLIETMPIEELRPMVAKSLLRAKIAYIGEDGQIILKQCLSGEEVKDN